VHPHHTGTTKDTGGSPKCRRKTPARHRKRKNVEQHHPRTESAPPDPPIENNNSDRKPQHAGGDAATKQPKNSPAKTNPPSPHRKRWERTNTQTSTERRKKRDTKGKKEKFKATRETSLRGDAEWDLIAPPSILKE
jgi:hypothetical protein